VNDVEAWLYFDGPEPAHIRPLLDALRDLPPSTPEDKQRMSRRFFERLDAELARQREPSVTTTATATTRTEGKAERWTGEVCATARSPSLDERPAAPPPAEPPSPPVAAGEPRPPTGRLPDPLTQTSLALDLPPEVRERLGGLPFQPRPSGTDINRTMQVPVMNLLKGETLPFGDDVLAKAVAALPFAENTAGAGLVPFPRLSLERYAALRAELSLWPERSAEILPRYHVMTEAARRALEEHWQAELAASPAARATFEKVLADYTSAGGASLRR
jgi:hypothetical protein